MGSSSEGGRNMSKSDRPYKTASSKHKNDLSK